MADKPDQQLEAKQIEQIVEAALLAADSPLTVPALGRLFAPGELDEETAGKQIRDAIKALTEQAQERGIELKRVASGYRYQVRQELSQWISRLWDEKPPRYTRALLETLALVAYKQPVTRGDIEQVRGVSVSQNIMRTLIERDWIKVVGHREVPGRPSEYGTTKAFLDYFNLKSLNELPPLDEIKAILDPAVEAIAQAQQAHSESGEAGNDGRDTDETDTAETDTNKGDTSADDNSSEPSFQAHVELPQEGSAGVVADESQPSAEIVQLHGNPNS
ncbi:MAG: SMC-Scp complex subunit ScpB [Pseudomonadota bacterium]